MKNLERCVERFLESKSVENIIVKVGRGEDVLCEMATSAHARQLTDKTLFDMASVTKIVVTTTLALMAIDKGSLSPLDRVDKFFSTPSDKQNLTIHNLLTHTMGIGHKSMLPSNLAYDEIQNYILSIPSDIPIGTDVLYSCPGFILLGRILEKIFDCRLDEAFEKYVALPLGMNLTSFLPDRERDSVNSNLSNDHLGVVNDYNCRYLGGVSGNAGLFSCVSDMTRYVKTLLEHGAPLFSEDVFELAVKNHTEGMSASRGLGYLYVDEGYSQTGGLFANGSIGHCGHTGQSVFVELKSGLYVIVLSDATISTVKKYGKENYNEVMQMRRDVHMAIKNDLNL